LAVANEYSDDVSILTGNGDGTFADAENFRAGNSPVSLCSNDFDGDGIIDLAVVNFDLYSGQVAILSGIGNGDFGPPHFESVNSKSQSVCSGDFDEDGHVDLAVASEGLSNVAVLINKGDGRFFNPDNYSTGYGSRSICSDDFNEDGHIDLAVANEGSDNISIMIGAGDGTFSASTIGFAGSGPVFVCSSDFDDDGHADLAIADVDGKAVWIWFGNGDGTFPYELRTGYEVGDWPYEASPVDLDGDDDIDLAVVNGRSCDVSVLINEGGGTFFHEGFYCAEGFPNSVCSGDFDADGYFDLAAANSSSENVTVFINRTGALTGSEAEASVPRSDVLLSNYPNPFNPITTFSFTIPEAGRVNISIFDAAGRFVRRLVEKDCGPGIFEIAWDGRNESGVRVNSGIYFARMTMRDFQSVRKVVLLR
jgi:hypothetical protein